jgi:predicted PurR-regulated permease PerM
MNESLLIPYVGSFLSLFLLAISFLLNNEMAKKAFGYMVVILSALNLFLCATYDANVTFSILNAGLVAMGAGSLLDE